MQHLVCGLLISWLCLGGFVLAGTTEHSSERCTVTGVVTDHRGQPVARAVISLFRENDEAKVIATASSDRRGQYSMSRLSPGVYRLLAAARGFQPLLSEPTALVPGQISQLHFALRPVPDARTSGINPVKYQNRRNRGIFNATASTSQAPVSGLPGSWQGTALVGSAGYSTQVEAAVTPELTLGFHLRHGWEGDSTTTGGVMRYLTGAHRLQLAMQTDTVTAKPPVSEETSSTHLLLRHGVHVTDTWRITDAFQILYGFDYIRTEGAQHGDWFPRLAVQWQPGLALQLHAAMTADGRSLPAGTNLDSPFWMDTFPAPPVHLTLAGGRPRPARRLRRQIGANWQISPQTAISALAYQDMFTDYPLVQGNQIQASLGGRNHGVAVVLVHQLCPYLGLTTAYAAGRGATWPQTEQPWVSRLPDTYHIVSVAAEMALHHSGTQVQLGYRRAWGNPVHAIDPFVEHLPLAASGLSFNVIQTLPGWLMLPGQWEAILEARNLDQRRDEVIGPSAAMGLFHRRLLRGGLRFRF